MPIDNKSWGEATADHWRGLSGRTRKTIIALVVMGALFAVAWRFCFFMGCPDVHKLASYQPGGAPVLLDRNGKEFASLAPVEGEIVSLKLMPKYVGEAFIAVEDQRFRDHGAIDLRRVLGAVAANVKSGGVEEGSSTLTMQLARNVFPDRLPSSQRTFTRKILEVRVAQEIEDQFTKDEILEMYLNHIYFGSGARGVEAASRHYFGKSAQQLALHEAAMLAALPKAPSHYNPRTKAKAARERRDLVLKLMEAQERITPAESEAARKMPIKVVAKARAPRAAPVFAGYVLDEVRRELEEKLGPDLYDEKLRIHTTIDAAAQKAAEEELERQLAAIESGGLGAFNGPRYSVGGEPGADETPYVQGAVVALDAQTGDILAWVGGRDFRQSRFDRVRGSQRQAGSAFKPFVYAAALASGRVLSQRIADEPLKVPLDSRRSWEPKNFDLTFDGPITLRDALVRSKNIPTIKLAQEVGFGAVTKVAEDAGIQPPIPQQPSMALGTVSVSPLELAAAYTTFASLGERVQPRLISKVLREDGSVAYEADAPEKKRVLDPGVAYLVTDALREALLRGTGTAVRQSGFKGAAAGKTGTTNDGADAWFVGYTPEMVASVWIGFDEQRPIMPKATGGRLAAPVWARLMTRIYAGRAAPAGWTKPGDVVEATVDPLSGMVLQPGCRPSTGNPYREVFLQGSVPQSICPFQGEAMVLDMAELGPLPDYEEGMETGLPADVMEDVRRIEREQGQTEGEEEAQEAREQVLREAAEAAAAAQGSPLPGAVSPAPASTLPPPPVVTRPPVTATPRPEPVRPPPSPRAEAPPPRPEATPVPPPAESPRDEPAEEPEPAPEPTPTPRPRRLR